MPPVPARPGALGVSMIEILVCLGLLALLTNLALPSARRMLDWQRLHGRADQLMADLQQSRSDALRLATEVHFQLQRGSEGACYVVHVGQRGDCTCGMDGRSTCQPGALALRSQGFARDQDPTELRSNVNHLLFSGRQGTVSSTGTLELAHPDGRAVRVVVSLMGRTRRCTLPQAHAGLPACV